MNISTTDIKINKTQNSRLHLFDPNNVQFGKIYSDHMLVCKYADGKWGTPEISEYKNLSLSPATTFIHYGQSIFEGVKAYKNPQGQPIIFRPLDNWKRMNKSAERMAMPDVPEDIFMDGIRELVALDRDWIPEGEGHSLYIRPFMFATDEFIGVRPAEQFTFMIITSPAGPYYAKPVSIYVEENYVRAVPGGIGYTKAAGNYCSSMYPTQEVKKKGFDQILWTDALEHKYVQEIGTMNFFVIFKDKVVTPDLSLGTILEGVTRNSVITLLREKGLKVEERRITIDEIIERHENGELLEAFGTGTAASIAPISDLTYQGKKMQLPSEDKWENIIWLKKEMANIRYGKVPDRHNWNFVV